MIADGVLICRLHGWQFSLATGECLTSNDCRLQVEPVQEPVKKAA